MLSIAKNADAISVSINLCGIAVWYIIWKRFGLFQQRRKNPFSDFIFYSLIGVLLFNIHISRSSPQTYEKEVQKIKEIEQNTRTLCGNIVTLFLFSKTLQQANVSKHIQRTFLLLMTLATAFTLFVLYDFSLPKKAEDIRILRKIESVSLNISTSFTLLMILCICSNLI